MSDEARSSSAFPDTLDTWVKMREILGTQSLQKQAYEDDECQQTQDLVSSRSVSNLHVRVNAANY